MTFETLPTRKELHDAIITASGIIGMHPQDGWGDKSPFLKTANKLQNTNADLTEEYICNRIYAAFTNLNFMHTIVMAAWHTNGRRLSKAETDRRRASAATSLPNPIQANLPKKEYHQKLESFLKTEQVKRLHPDSARVLSLYFGREGQQIWAIDFLGKALAHAYEDITGKIAGCISETASGVSGPGKSFVGFSVSIIEDINEAKILPDEVRYGIGNMEPQAFKQSILTMSAYNKDYWAAVVKFLLCNCPFIATQLPSASIVGWNNIAY